MTREEAIAEVNKLGLTGQAREQKINELIGKKASDFKGGTWIDEAMAGRDGEAEKKIEELEEKKRMETPIDGSKGNIARGNQGDNNINNPYKMSTAEIDGKHKEELANAQNQLGTTNVGSYTTDNTFKIGSNYGKGFIGADKTTGESETASSSNKKNNLDYRTRDYMDNNKAVANKAKKEALEDIDIDAIKNWEDMYKTADKTVAAYGNIDKKYINELPTFMYRRYKNGEFGNLDDPESKKNAQLRLAHFMINGLGSKLKVASNLAMINAGKTPMFSDTTSDYEKFQNSNLEQGLANRWKVNNAETEEVIKLANKEADNEQDARIYVEQLTRDNNLKTAWNMMDQNQKLYAVNVSRKVGELIGDMNMKELANFITASALNGNLSEEQAVVAGLAALVSKSPEMLDKIKDGDYKDLLLKHFFHWN